MYTPPPRMKRRFGKSKNKKGLEKEVHNILRNRQHMDKKQIIRAVRCLHYRPRIVQYNAFNMGRWDKMYLVEYNTPGTGGRVYFYLLCDTVIQ